MLTLDELKEKLLHAYDIELLIELLQIEGPELLDRFEDRLMMKATELQKEIENVFD